MKTTEFDTKPRMPIFNIDGEVLTLTPVAPPRVLPCPRELRQQGRGHAVERCIRTRKCVFSVAFKKG